MFSRFGVKNICQLVQWISNKPIGYRYQHFWKSKFTPPFHPRLFPLSRRMLTTMISDPRINTDHCPGCGAKFQTRDDSKPGFLVIPKLEKKNSITKPGELGTDDIQKLVRSMPDDILKQLYPMGVTPELIPPDKVNEKSYSRESAPMSGNQSKKKTDHITGEEERIFCQRCYNLLYHNKVVTEEWQESLTSDRLFLSFLKKKDAVVVTVVDIFDFPGTLLKGLDDLIGVENPTILVANKMDLLPKDVNETRIKNWLKVNSEKHGFRNIHDIFLISAKKNWRVQELAQAISTIRSGFDDVYLIGCANVGKSELINSFLRSTVVGGWKYEVTSSPIPGTTVGMLGLPLKIFGSTFGHNPKGFHFPQGSRYIYDTPGIVNGKQLIHLLTEEELKMVVPQKNIKPRTYNMFPGKSLFLGGLGRIDYVDGDKPVRMTVFSRLKPHITSIRRADEICQSMAVGDKTFLEPPTFSIKRTLPFPPMIKSKRGYVLKGVPGTMSSKDVVFSGIGWASFGGTFNQASIDIWSPNGIGIYIRDKSLLPFEFRGIFKKLP
ncbi:18006_t:CDS:2 [Acaulospora morrowiae]|uniref:18006_t:CDS:1 n=1 Tax=Acaulospora morrowiae TaxID=94023 RepID=A0A9N9FMZ2_9GLOM|nr:18006_t:CDS:2 [Acaulospora morrowiae]